MKRLVNISLSLAILFMFATMLVFVVEWCFTVVANEEYEKLIEDFIPMLFSAGILFAFGVASYQSIRIIRNKGNLPASWEQVKHKNWYDSLPN